MTITQQTLLNAFLYKDGVLYWKISPSPSVKIGAIAGCLNNGYTLISINKTYIHAHRAIFLMHHGFLPEIVDHIDGNRSNNQLNNLRAATKAQNAWNSKLHKHNTSGVRGVSWNKQTKKWRAAINVNGKALHLGRFNDIKEAENAVKLARETYHGHFARQS